MLNKYLGKSTAPLGLTDTRLFLANYAEATVGRYLELNYLRATEIVLVTGKRGGGLVILRGRDNTEPQAFPTGTRIREVLTEEGLRKQVSGIVPLIVRYSGGMEVEGQTARYLSPSFTFDGPHYLAGSQSSKLVIGRTEEPYGCCDGGGEAREATRYFYVTSRPYAYDTKERIQVGAVSTVSLVDNYHYTSVLENIVVAGVSIPTFRILPVIEYTEAYFDPLDGQWKRPRKGDSISITGVAVPTLSPLQIGYSTESIGVIAVPLPTLKDVIVANHKYSSVLASAYSTPTLS